MNDSIPTVVSQDKGTPRLVAGGLTKDNIEQAIAGVRGLQIRGAAISMPWKEDVIPLVDELDASAAVIESVNTIVNTDGHLTAYNTDYLAS
ncbi:hypothetical protein [uncultured Corynebacterium sp.]|uniref:hypothetical protein n=1 Tax=uncultured Corynebacterium sp. TaxID=159447 RepID=UPI0025FAD110|nr:hypothetical protein [uncultured Corynebacterium sp.]